MQSRLSRNYSYKIRANTRSYTLISDVRTRKHTIIIPATQTPQIELLYILCRAYFSGNSSGLFSSLKVHFEKGDSAYLIRAAHDAASNWFCDGFLQQICPEAHLSALRELFKEKDSESLLLNAYEEARIRAALVKYGGTDRAAHTSVLYTDIFLDTPNEKPSSRGLKLLTNKLLEPHDVELRFFKGKAFLFLKKGGKPWTQQKKA